VRSTKRSEMRRGHGSVRKHGVQRKHMLEVVREHSRRATGHVLLRIDGLVRFDYINVLY
jgi:hypothetical protein